MSVLIKGMEMPKSCIACPMLEGDRMDGLCHAVSRWLDDDEYWTWYLYPEGDMDDSKPCNCPLVPVPTPHGRLIDAGELEDKLDAWTRENFSFSDRYQYNLEGMIRASDFAMALPTIIEAEEGEEK